MFVTPQTTADSAEARSKRRRPRAMAAFAALAGLLAVGRPAVAQDATGVKPPGALAGVAKRLLAGKDAAPGAALGATRFTPAPRRVFVPKMVETLGEKPEERKALTELFTKTLDVFDKEAKKAGLPNDLAPALAFYIQTLWEIQSGKSAPEAGGDAMVVQVRSVLDGPEVSALSDEEKQSLYEYWVCSATLTLTLQEVAQTDKAAAANLKTQVGTMLKGLVGADASQFSITAKGITFAGAASGGGAATPPGTPSLGGASAAKVTYQTPAGARVENLSGATILHLPKYVGYTQNDVEQIYLCVLPAVASASKPDREAAFEDAWQTLTKDLGVQWVSRTVIHRYTLPTGAVCYTALAGNRSNAQHGAYGSADIDRLTLCLLDFGAYYVPVAQVYRTRQGSDNEYNLRAAFEGLLPTVRVAGVATPTPKPYIARDQVLGTWTHADGYYSSTDYVYASNGAFAGSTVNASASRNTVTFKPNGTARYEFYWWFNGRIQTDVWDGTWTLKNGIITMRNPKTNKTQTFTAVYSGKQPKTGEKFLALYQPYPRDASTTPASVHSSDTKLFTPLKR